MIQYQTQQLFNNQPNFFQDQFVVQQQQQQIVQQALFQQQLSQQNIIRISVAIPQIEDERILFLIDKAKQVSIKELITLICSKMNIGDPQKYILKVEGSMVIDTSTLQQGDQIDLVFKGQKAEIYNNLATKLNENMIDINDQNDNEEGSDIVIPMPVPLPPKSEDIYSQRKIIKQEISTQNFPNNINNQSFTNPQISITQITSPTSTSYSCQSLIDLHQLAVKNISESLQLMNTVAAVSTNSSTTACNTSPFSIQYSSTLYQSDSEDTDLDLRTYGIDTPNQTSSKKQSFIVSQPFLAIINGSIDRIILNDMANYYRLIHLKISDPVQLFNEIQERCNLQGFKIIITFNGRSKIGTFQVDLCCHRSEEAYYIGEADDAVQTCDCQFKLEYQKNDMYDNFQLHKYIITHNHDMDEDIKTTIRLKKANSPYFALESNKEDDDFAMVEQCDAFIGNVITELDNIIEIDQQNYCNEMTNIQESNSTDQKQQMHLYQHDNLHPIYDHDDLDYPSSNQQQQVNESSENSTKRLKLQRDIRKLKQEKKQLREQLGIKGRGRGRWKRQIDMNTLNDEEKELAKKLQETERILKEFERNQQVQKEITKYKQKSKELQENQRKEMMIKQEQKQEDEK